MNWKQFLKPNWRKIVIFFAILFLELMALLMFYPYEWASTATYYQTCCKSGLPEEIIKSCMRDNITAEELCITLKDKVERQALQDDVVLVINLAVVYLLSCLIIWFYDNRKKRK
jgi:hypothetical protein